MRNFTVFAILLASIMQANAESQIKWLGTVHDFGAFDEDTKHKTALFRFINTGDEDVAIVSASATCGCTVPKYSKEPVAPGDTAVIEVSYDPSGRPGRFEKQIYVRTTASLDRNRLTIKGTVIGNAETVKARYPVSAGDLKLRNGVAMMGRVYHGHSKMQYVDGYNQSADTLRPVVTNTPDYIEVTSVPEAVGPGEPVTFNFYFRGDRCDQWGIVTDSVTIAPYPGAEGVVFPVVAVIEEDFSQLTSQQLADAPKLSLPDERVILPDVPLHSTKPVSKKVKITNKGRSPLVIHRAYSADQGVGPSISAATIAPGKDAWLIIKYDPSAQPTGIINAKVTLITNDPDNSSYTLRVVGERK